MRNESNFTDIADVKSCIRCVMNDFVDPEISFDEMGLCKHCKRYDSMVSSRVFNGVEGEKKLTSIVSKIQAAGKDSDYDCIIGVSGGVDSTYVAYLVKHLGLRPLAIHFDNGWNSELAVKNIEAVLSRLDIDLYTYVVNWREFRDLQVSFLRASTPDGEIPTDHAIFALLWREASRRNIKYIISGMNFRSESISVPNWSYGHSDWRYIRGVHKEYGCVPLKTYPHFSLFFLLYINLLKRIRTVSILNYTDYDKEKVKQFLIDELGWRDYGGKHHESIYTRFYQGVLLPQKFHVDKRYGHLSDLINAGQLDRATALLELKKPTYDVEQQRRDRAYVMKKLGLTEEQFSEIESRPRRGYGEFKNSRVMVEKMRSLANWLRAHGLYPR
ncbi:N-acetyl sugar amidotransferase [Luminiphilus sp.]|nr:N-acetyl sugar amidotransferase [Luminiphilus sp.]